MSAKSRVKLKICSNEFIVTSEDSEEYIRHTGDLVEQRIKNLMNESENMSVSMAAVFAAMEFCDESVKAKESADNLRSQIKDYLEEAGKARAEEEETGKENQSLKQELQALKTKYLQKDKEK